MPAKPAPGPAERSECPISCALDLLGDRWTLLVLRDVLFSEKSLFNELLDSPESISSNTLSDRLKRLEQYGILIKEPYQERPLRHRYVPTERGRDLIPLLVEAVRWGAKHVPGAHQPTPEQMAWMEGLLEHPTD
jgi:DNA-binding HxlR family transcriptional regulator